MNSPTKRNKNLRTSSLGTSYSSSVQTAKVEQDSADLLLVIDMQNTYTKEGPWTCPNIDRAAERIITLIKSGWFGQIIFTRFDSPQTPVGNWKLYNQINREINGNIHMNELISVLKPYTDTYPLYSKSTYSSITVPEIQTAIQDCIDRGGSLVLTGVVSECCVLATAFHAIDMGCPVVYIKDACAGSSDEMEKAVINVLAGLDYVQTTILDTAEYLKI